MIRCKVFSTIFYFAYCEVVLSIAEDNSSLVYSLRMFLFFSVILFIMS